MMSSWLSPPRTRAVQFDEMGAFVGKKQKNCDAADPGEEHKGDYWDHVASDPEHKLVWVVVPGARVTESAQEVVTEAEGRLDESAPVHLTSDEYPVYQTVIEEVLSQPEVAAPGPARPGRRRLRPRRRLDPRVTYATVRKEREGHRVVAVHRTVVLGSQQAVDAALEASVCSRTVNTSFVERQHATARGQNARQSRRTSRFSKDWEVHEAMSDCTRYRSNFCWPVRTLPVRGDEGGGWQQRTPAMSAGLADHVWSLEEWLRFPAVQRN
jgi:IS1 family transposase